jgi:SAM-dependent methyltransferase
VDDEEKEMQPKPENFSTNYAEEFKRQQVVDAYRNRPPYPAEVFDILAHLITDEPRAVLDVGAGSGDIARHLVDFVERVDAVDFSQNMIARGKQLPNGNHLHLNWIYGKVEEVPLTPPYALITAGSSIHWTDWPVAFPRFRSLLTPNSYLALIYRRVVPMPWDNDLSALQALFSTRSISRSSKAARELEMRGFFHPQGQKETTPIPFSQSIADFIEGLHSRSGLSRQRMGPQLTTDFDQYARTILTPYSQDGMLSFHIVGTVTWGTPANGDANVGARFISPSVSPPGPSVPPLIILARAWVRENYGRHAEHLLKAEEWLRRINPHANEAMLLATLTHDMERAFPGPDSPKQDPSLGPDDPIYNQAHSQRSARIVSAFLHEQQVSEPLVTEIARLIEVHEMGGWPEADWVQAADSLSFLEVNIDFFLDRINAPENGWTLAQVQAKFAWMYQRIKIASARELATPLYEQALRKLRDKEVDKG